MSKYDPTPDDNGHGECHKIDAVLPLAQYISLMSYVNDDYNLFAEAERHNKFLVVYAGQVLAMASSLAQAVELQQTKFVNLLTCIISPKQPINDVKT